jgi:hypothetical protein
MPLPPPLLLLLSLLLGLVSVTSAACVCAAGLPSSSAASIFCKPSRWASNACQASTDLHLQLLTKSTKYHHVPCLLLLLLLLLLLTLLLAHSCDGALAAAAAAAAAPGPAGGLANATALSAPCTYPKAVTNSSCHCCRCPCTL